MDITINFRNTSKSTKPYSQSFYGKREDNNLVSELTQEGTLNFSKEKKILKTIEKMSKDGSSSNVNFLFNIIQNLKYGASKNSPLGVFLYSQSSINEKNETQNVDWQKKLVEALDNAISKNNSPDKYRFQSQLEALANPKTQNRYSTNPVSRVDNPIFLKQAELIKLRNELLEKNSIKDSVDIVPKDSKHSIRNNLDYFIGMSECSLGEKVSCLNILNYMMGDEYNINPQLADKKVQLLTEILNDIVVKTPDFDKFQIKKVDQGSKGKCAAISMARKAIPYEHKLLFLNNVMNELDDKPTMDVYDITDPSGTKKVSVEKAKIDYNYELKNKSRILDAASENWMNIADNILEGGNLTSKYVSSDKEHYGMFADGHYLPDLEGSDFPKQQFLRASQKLDSVIELITSTKTDSLSKYEAEKKSNSDNAAFINFSIANTSKILLGLSSELSEDDAYALARELLNPSKVDDENLKIDSAEDDIVKKYKLKTLIKNDIEKIDSVSLDESIDSILGDLKTVENIRKKEKADSAQSLNKNSYRYNARLFKAAAFYRVKTEFQLDIPEQLEKVAKDLNVPPEKESVLKKLEQKNIILSRQLLDSIYAKVRLAEDPDNKKHKLILSNAEKTQLQSYVSILTKLKKENKRDIDSYTRELGPKLKELYSDYARSRGQNWVGTEGSSGLCVREMIENISKLTGYDHYAEKDAQKALNAIENGVGDSISATNVSTSMISGHAQYAYGVEKRPVVDEKTGETKFERFLAHDNTWGDKVESEHVWKDAAGNIRTDYKRQMGGKNGFIAFDEGTTGVSESELTNGQGFDEKINYHFPVYKHIVLNGNFDSIQDEAKSLIREMPTKEHAALSVSMYMSGLMSGNAPDILAFQDELNEKVLTSILNRIENNDLSKENSIENVTMLLSRKYSTSLFKAHTASVFASELQRNINSMIDEIMSSNEDETYKKIHIIESAEKLIEYQVKKDISVGKLIDTKQVNATSDSFKSIKNLFYKKIGINLKEKVHENIDDSTLKSDFDKLPNDDEIKIILRKISLKELTKNKKILAELKKAKNQDELDKIYNQVVEDKKESIKKQILSSADISSVSELEKSTDGKALVAWIDEKYNPENDESLLDILKSISKKSSSELDSIVDSSLEKELSIHPRDEFSIYKNIRNYKENELAQLNSVLYEENSDKFGFQKYSEDIAKIESEHEKWKQSDEGKGLSEIDQNRRLNKEIIKMTSKYPEIMYQNLSIYFSYLEIAGLVDSFKGMMKERGIYTGLPVRKIIPDSELEKVMSGNIDKLVNVASAISALSKENTQESREQVNACKEDLNKLSDVFVLGNVRPRSRNALKSDLKMLYKTIYAGDSQKAQMQYKNVLTRVQDDHLLKHPQELLDVVAKEVPSIDSTDLKNKNFNQELVNIWSDYLVKAKIAADNTVFELMMMKKVEDGKMPQIAKLLKSEESALLMNRKGQKCSLDSEEGLDFVFKALEDPANNNETLKYFFLQTGMVSSSLQNLMSGPGPEKYVKFIKIIADKCDQRIEQYKFIDEKFDKFIQSGDFDSKASASELSDTLYKFLENEYKSASFKNDSPLNEYKEKIDLYIQQNQNSELNSTEILQNAHKAVNDSLDDYSEDAIERIIRHQGLLTKQKNGVSVLIDLLPESSDIKGQAKEYIEKIDSSIQVLDKYRQKYQNPILEKIEKAQQKNIEAEKVVNKKDTVKPDFNEQIKMLKDSIASKDDITQKAAINLLINNKDDKLTESLINMLGSDNPDDLIRTYAVGILWSKGIIEPLVDYINNSLTADSKLDLSKQDDQALVLATDALVEKLSKSTNSDEVKDIVDTVKKLFIAACDKDAKTPLADQLLQTFINILPNKGEHVNRFLYDLAVDKNTDMNAKTVAIDALGRNNTSAFYPLFEKIVANPQKFVKNDNEILNILDVATKGLESMMKVFPGIDYSTAQRSLANIDIDRYETSDDNASALKKRIKSRISNIQNK